MGLPDPAGSLAKVCYLGKTDVVEGAIDTNITIPGGTQDYFLFKALPSWNTIIWEHSSGTSVITIGFSTPAPPGAFLRWGLWK